MKDSITKNQLGFFFERIFGLNGHSNCPVFLILRNHFAYFLCVIIKLSLRNDKLQLFIIA